MMSLTVQVFLAGDLTLISTSFRVQGEVSVGSDTESLICTRLLVDLSESVLLVFGLLLNTALIGNVSACHTMKASQE